MKLMSIKKTLKIVPLLVSLQLLAACGGGGGEGNASRVAPAGNEASPSIEQSLPDAATSSSSASSASQPMSAPEDGEQAASSSASSLPEPPPTFSSKIDALQYALQKGDARVVDAKLISSSAVAYVTYDTRVVNLPKWLTQPTDLAKMLERLGDGSFSTNWSGCADEPQDSPTFCSGDQAYMNEFGNMAGLISKELHQLDADGTKLFGNADYRLEQLLVLLGDRYRLDASAAGEVTKESDKTAFLRMRFADAVSYTTRN